MTRLRYNGLTATLGAALTSSATSVTFGAALTHANGVAVPTIASPDYLPLSILDSSGNFSEIVYLTAYTSGATTGTISRAQEGTTGVAHSSGDKVVHGPTVVDFAGDTSWIAPTLQNGWVNYGDPTWSNAGYRKDSAGVVHLQGLVKNGTGNVAIFTLPAGYRPAKQKPFLVESSARPSGISVNADGTVVLSFGAGGSGFYVYLDAISFVADQ